MSYLPNTFASQTSKTFAGDIRFRFDCIAGGRRFALDFVSSSQYPCDGRKSLTGLFWVTYHAQHTAPAHLG